MSHAAQTITNAPTARFPDQTGWIRRADVSLRTHYPNLVTRIFEITPHNFLIVFDKALQDVSSINFEEFRPIALHAGISNEVPKQYLREISPIPDSQLARHFEGFPFTLIELLNLVVARFPHLPIAAIRDDGRPIKITVELTTAINAAQQSELLDFCMALGAPAPFQIIITGRTLEETRKPVIVNPLGSQSDALFIGASRLRPGLPAYVYADEAFWFDNLDRICGGGMTVEQMPGISEGDARCYIDATIGEHINFRQLLAYYDTIYFSPPLLEEHEAFLDRQALTEADLLNLVGSGRLKILQTQAEERLNVPFLSASTERSTTAIIGRRSAAAILIADIVHTADRYRLNDRDQYKAIGELSRAAAEKSGMPADKILQFMLWPVEARRAAVGALLNRGSKGMLPIGMGPYFASLIKKLSGKDLELELLMVSEKVHIAHAIGATAFPMREEPVGMHGLANMMGDALNFFRSFNTEVAASWVGNVERKQQAKVLLPPLPILEFDATVPIDEVLMATERPVMRNRRRALFSRLADLTEDERAAEIRDLNTQLRHYGRPKGIMSLDTADTALSVIATAIGFSYPPVAGLAHIAAQFFDIGKRYPSVDSFFEAVRTDLFPGGSRKRELDFLSRLNRVASFKIEKVS